MEQKELSAYLKFTTGKTLRDPDTLGVRIAR